jgi:dolichol-phosphate mannosyltransferase
MKKISIAVLIPSYNEAQNIPGLLSAMQNMSAKLSDVGFTLYVIDDSSPDGTAEVVEKLNTQLETANFCTKVIRRAQKEGLGRAYIDGFKQMLTLNSPPDFVLQMDADLSHNPEYIVEYVKAVRNGADFIVGTRYIYGGSCPDWSWYRKLLSRGGNAYARVILGRKITDYTGGFNMFSLEILNKIRWDELDSAGYGFLIDLKYQTQRLSKKIIEIPIQFVDRQHGQSKMPLNTIFQNFALVLRIKMKHLLEK